MQKNIINILSQIKTYKPIWYNIFNQADAVTQLMRMFIPVFEFVSTQVICSPLISQDSINKIIIQDLTAKISPTISRVCIMEMHSLRDKGVLTGDTPESRYAYYVNLLSEPENAISLLQKYPVLENYISIIVANYIENFRNILTRLEQDWPLIKEKFSFLDNEYCTNIVSSGDSHAGGQSVCILTFFNSKNSIENKIVYKPRSLKIDDAYYAILYWVNQHLPYKHYIPTIIDQYYYGWYEYIIRDECADFNSIENFYRRLGSLLAVIYLLKGSDIHAENLIARGEFPVVIDLECLMQPAELSPHYLVSQTLFLPYRSMAKDNYNGYDISAVMGSEESLSPYFHIDWDQTGTDQMRARRTKIKIPPSQNRPQKHGVTINPLEYEPQFTQGFVDTYTLITQHKSLFINDGFLTAFNDAKIRILLRHTGSYSKLLYESFHPEIWYFAEKRQSHFQWLLQQQQQKFQAEIYPHEIIDLLTGDIPAFYINTCSKTIIDAQGKPVAIALKSSGSELMMAHINQKFNQQDLDLQVCLIRQSYACANANQQPKTTRQSHYHQPLPCQSAAISHSLVDNAGQLLHQVLEKISQYAVITEHKIAWPSIIESGMAIRNPGMTNLSLYDGVSGIGIIFGYAAVLLDNPGYLKIAKDCYETIITTDENTLSQLEIGAFSGISGIIYALAQFIKLGIADDNARSCIKNLMTTLLEKIPNTSKMDIIEGFSGCIAALYAVKNIIDEEIFQVIMTQCMARFLDLYSKPLEGITGDCGFAHGIHGLAWTLAKYANIYHDLPLANIHACDWCYGWTGQALALWDFPISYKNDAHQQFISNAIQETLTHGFYSYKNLCHGDLGNLDFLWEIANRNSDKSLYDKTIAMGNQLIHDMIHYPYQYDATENCFNPGLMCGEAGIAYICLRFLYFERIPNILLLQHAYPLG